MFTGVPFGIFELINNYLMKKLYFILLLYVSIQVQAQQTPSPCNNLNFETGTTTNWRSTSYPFYPYQTPMYGDPPAPPPIKWVGQVVNNTSTVGTQCTNGVDNYGGFPVVAPDGGQYSFLLNNDSAGGKLCDLSVMESFVVTPNNASYTFRFAAVLQDVGHTDSTKPYFIIEITGNFQAYIMLFDTSLTGWQTSSVDSTVRYLPWTTASVNLSAFMGSTIYIHMLTNDCADGAHFGYAYVDATCSDFKITSSNPLCTIGDSTMLSGPPGMKNYMWLGPKIGNASTLTTNIPGTYTLITNSLLSIPEFNAFLPADTFYYHLAIDSVTSSFIVSNVCSNDTGFFFDHSTGAPNDWIWNFGDGTTLLHVQNPTHVYNTSGIYTPQLITKNACGVSDTVYSNIYVDLPVSVSFTIQKDSTQPHVWNVYPNYPSGTVDVYWSWGDFDGSFGFYPSYTYANPGIYNVCVSAYTSSGCSANFCLTDSLYRIANSTYDSVVQINVMQNQTSGISTHNTQNSTYKIYPNPAQNNFTVEVSTNEKQTISLFDINGKQVLSQTITGTTNIDASNLANGVYNISIANNYGVVNKRLVIVK